MTAQDKWDARRELEKEILQMESDAASADKTTLPDVTLTEKTYDAPSDDELKKSAESSLEKYKKDSIDAINESSANSEKELTGKRETVDSNMKNALSSLEDDYNAAAKRIDNDVIKRGLARSSVAVTGKADLEREYLSRSDQLKSGYQKQLDALDSEISSIGTKLKKALDDFNLSYAAKLNETLASLKAEREKKQDEVLKYNNEIRAKQAELDRKRAETESKLSANAQNSDEAKKIKEELYKSIYEKMDAYLGAMDKGAARLEIRNHTMYQEHLSPLYYYMLYDKYGR